MTDISAQSLHAVEWNVSSRAAPGETVSGDLHVVSTWEGGALVGVIDGLGHGEEATAAAQIAVNELQRQPRQPVTALVDSCHRALRNSRGVVMTLLSFNALEHTVSAIGVGNVETVIVRSNPAVHPRRESVLLRSGVVGYQLPALHATVWSIAPGDVAVFATDGVREDFSDLILTTDPLARVVEKIMSLKFRGTDDGLVLACKYTGDA